MQQSRWLNWMIEQSSLRNAESLIRFGAEKLSSISNVPRLEAEVLLSNLLKINPMKFHTDDIGISSNVMDKFESMIESRFKGMPIAYLIGKKEFWSLDFEINPSLVTLSSIAFHFEMTIAFSLYCGRPGFIRRPPHEIKDL